MTDFNPQDFTRQSVTPIKRKVNGVVYERTGEKREPKPGELIWFDAQRPEPYAFVATKWKGNARGKDAGTRICERCGRSRQEHYHNHRRRDAKWWCPGPVTPIWIRSEDQSWEPPSFPEVKDESEIDRLIRQLKLTETGLGNESIPALGILYQAKALERIADALECRQAYLDARQEADNLLDIVKRQDAQLAESRAVCSMCNHGEHASCQGSRKSLFPFCQCPSCHQSPQNGEQVRHPFEGMEDNHFCTRCGGGRLHGIHQ